MHLFMVTRHGGSSTWLHYNPFFWRLVSALGAEGFCFVVGRRGPVLQVECLHIASDFL
jgi:hypothetical protein